MAANNIIRMVDIDKSYTIGGITTQILKKISLDVVENDLLAIVGASGSGKSTLMNLLGLLDKADQGEYWLADRNIALLNQDELAKLRNQYIGFVFQQFNLLSRFTARQNVALPLTYRNLHASEIEDKVTHALSEVGMAAFGHHKPTQLSGGQQQRVAIARALVGEPQVILADEPTGALDSRTGKEIIDLFFRLHALGKTVIVITHDEQIAKQCLRQITMADGQIMAEVNDAAA